MNRVITVNRDVSEAARIKAGEFRQMMARQGTLVANLISSPGAGKTTLLATIARRLTSTTRIGVLVGDIATDRDAQRLAPLVPTVQLTTGGACHLELSLVERGWEMLGAPKLDFLFVENVGNLVCPSSHDLGEHLRIVMLSATEGDDKPGKYPKAFRTSHALVINKLDLLQHVPFSVAAATADAQAIQPHLAVFPLSALTGDGIEPWLDFLVEEQRKVTADWVPTSYA
jgi:hydrogenase nickel incorporation protein HypB